MFIRQCAKKFLGDRVVGVVDGVRSKVGVVPTLCSAVVPGAAWPVGCNARSVTAHELRREMPGLVVDEKGDGILAEGRLRLSLPRGVHIDPGLKLPAAWKQCGKRQSTHGEFVLLDARAKRPLPRNT